MLDREICLTSSLLEFGLSEIRFESPAPVIPPKPNVNPVPAVIPDKIETESITLQKETNAIFNFHYPPRVGINGFISAINIGLEKEGRNPELRLIFLMEVVDKDTMKVEIEFTNTHGYFIELPKDFVKCIGFDTTIFPAGTYKGRPFKFVGCYDEMGRPDKLTIHAFRWITTTAVVKSHDKTDFESLLSEILTGLESTEFKIGIIHEEIGKVIFVEVVFYEPKIKMQLSPHKNKLLGLSPDYVFTKTQLINVPRNNFPIHPPAVDPSFSDPNVNSFLYKLSKRGELYTMI